METHEVPERVPPITDCKNLRSQCSVCKNEATGGVHIRTVMQKAVLRELLLKIDALDHRLFDWFKTKTVLLFADSQAPLKDNRGSILLSRSDVGGGTTLPSTLSKSGLIEVYIWIDMLDGRKDPPPVEGVNGKFVEKPIGILLHEMWHAFLHDQGLLWHGSDGFNATKACQAVYLLVEPLRKQLGLPEMKLSMIPSEVREAVDNSGLGLG
jgi:hypothetical protein